MPPDQPGRLLAEPSHRLESPLSATLISLEELVKKGTRSQGLWYGGCDSRWFLLVLEKGMLQDFGQR